MPKNRYARRRFSRNSGITRVEMLNLEKDCVMIRKDPDEDSNWGDLIIKRGLKWRARKRLLKINEESKQVLERLSSESKCRHIFSQPRHPDPETGALRCVSPQSKTA